MQPNRWYISGNREGVEMTKNFFGRLVKEIGLLSYKVIKNLSSLAFSTDGQLFASGSFDGLVQIWDINSGNLKCTLDGHNGGVEWIRWHPKGHLVLAGSEDSIVWMWNADKSAYPDMF